MVLEHWSSILYFLSLSISPSVPCPIFSYATMSLSLHLHRFSPFLSCLSPHHMEKIEIGKPITIALTGSNYNFFGSRNEELFDRT